jgi:hypothetical protein
MTVLRKRAHFALIREPIAIGGAGVERVVRSPSRLGALKKRSEGRVPVRLESKTVGMDEL